MSSSHSPSRSLTSPLFGGGFKSARFYNRLLQKAARPKSRRRLLRGALVGGNILILALIVGFIIHTPHQNVAATPALLAGPNQSQTVANPLDQLSSSTIALTVAQLDNLPETTAINDQAISDTTELALAPASNSVVAKPQVVATRFASNKDIRVYVTQKGDTIGGIAAKFGITSDSIRWSNNITGDAVSAGMHLVIPPVSGFVYVVHPGDTPASLAARYHADESKIIAYNDAEIGGLHVGERIIIPGGDKAVAAASSAPAILGIGDFGSASYGSNGYDFGFCTWWVAQLRARAGDPVPNNLGNASTWAIRAAEFGIPTGTVPRVGAAVVLSTVGAGHVGYVTAVNGNQITISEMNHEGWDITDTRTISGSGYSYVY